MTLAPPFALSPFGLDVPGDPSSAAFFAALASLATGGVLHLPHVLARRLGMASSAQSRR